MWYPLLYEMIEILVTNLFQGWRIADIILNFTNAVFDQSGSTFDNTNTFLFNAALFVNVRLVIYDVVSHFTEVNNISSSSNFSKDHMFFAISLYNFGILILSTLYRRIILNFGNIF